MLRCHVLQLAAVWLLAVPMLTAQAPARAAALSPIADVNATETGGVLLSIPGIADDLVLFADGAFEERANGTARLSAYVSRQSGIDREFYLVLELGGLLQPGSAGYPPAGAPVLTLLPSAYVPAGPVDPATFTYYTTGTGSLTGLRAYDGARLGLSLAQPAQLGSGASNKNVFDGLAADLTVTVLQQPTSGTLAPTGPASLRADLRAAATCCLSHVDSSLDASGTTDRLAMTIGGLGDFLFVPAGSFREDAQGVATVQAELRNPTDFADAWSLQLQLGGRLLPLATGYPPAGSPVLGLLPNQYALQGGPIDPDQWRYYTTATGTLTGLRDNAGGALQLGTAGPLQVGLGAGGGNRFFGVSGPLTVTLLTQPSTHTLTPTGTAQVQANLSSDCLLPAMVVATSNLTTPNVTTLRLQLSGTDIGLCEQVAIGPRILATDERVWFDGHVQPTSIDTVEIAVPQGLLPGPYPMLLIHRSGTSNPLVLNVQAPTTPTLATEPTRTTGDLQHWLAHRGNLPGLTICFFALSFSNLPSDIPGFVHLDLGAMFTDLFVLDASITDPFTGLALATFPSVAPGLQGLRVYAQAAFLDAAFTGLTETNLCFTDY